MANYYIGMIAGSVWGGINRFLVPSKIALFSPGSIALDYAPQALYNTPKYRPVRVDSVLTSSCNLVPSSYVTLGSYDGGDYTTFIYNNGAKLLYRLNARFIADQLSTNYYVIQYRNPGTSDAITLPTPEGMPILYADMGRIFSGTEASSDIELGRQTFFIRSRTPVNADIDYKYLHRITFSEDIGREYFIANRIFTQADFEAILEEGYAVETFEYLGEYYSISQYTPYTLVDDLLALDELPQLTMNIVGTDVVRGSNARIDVEYSLSPDIDAMPNFDIDCTFPYGVSRGYTGNDYTYLNISQSASGGDIVVTVTAYPFNQTATKTFTIPEGSSVTETVSIFLMRNNSERNVIGKSITTIRRITGTFRDAVDIINPSIQVDMGTFPDFNYLYIPKFKRYYFVDSIVNIVDGLWDISCTVDVLESFKDTILASSGLVERNEFEFNPKIIDHLRVIEQGVTTEVLTGGMTLETVLNAGVPQTMTETSPRFMLVGTFISLEGEVT